ncbi:MAG: hypothetical protein LBH03_02800, partial [Holophagales bacterium]|nr:hypothetical protein [Holophagales bacterium]
MSFPRFFVFSSNILAILLAVPSLVFAQGGAVLKDKREKNAKSNSEKVEIQPEKDDPIGRAKWFDEWFGPVTPEYLDYKITLAEREIQRWGHLIPGTPMYNRAAPAVEGGIPAKQWRDIGPWRGQSQVYLPIIKDPNIVDTGRPTVILPHPTNTNLIYVGFAGGGLWRCANADVTSNTDWVWEPMTDGLPGGGPAGNLSIGSAAFKPEDPNTIYIALGDMM